AGQRIAQTRGMTLGVLIAALLLTFPPSMNALVSLAETIASDRPEKAIRVDVVVGFMLVVLLQTLAMFAVSIWWERRVYGHESPYPRPPRREEVEPGRAGGARRRLSQFDQRHREREIRSVAAARVSHRQRVRAHGRGSVRQDGRLDVVSRHENRRVRHAWLPPEAVLSLLRQ